MSTRDRRGSAIIALALIPESVLEALLAGSLDVASEIMGMAFAGSCLTEDALRRCRLGQIRADLGQPAKAVVRRAGFHGPPDADGMAMSEWRSVRSSRRWRVITPA